MAGDERNQLASLLHEQRERLAALNELLREERTMLAERDMERLPTLLSRKVELLGAVESAENQRAALADHLGFGRADADMTAAVETLPDPEAARADWRQIVDALQDCRILNETNGRLIHQQQSGVQRTLELLQVEASNGGGYDRSAREADGSGTGSGRELGQA